MPFKIDPDDADLSAAMVRIAREEATRARREIADPALTTADKILQARKRTKRLRGMLRLFRPAFSDFSHEVSHLRRAARGLSQLRDRDVMIATHDRLMDISGSDRRAFAPVRAHLTRARNRVAATHDPDAALARFEAEMAALEDRAAAWKLRGKDARALREGLTRTLRQARAALTRAHRQEDIDDLHAWRKRVKDHWYQARLLTPAEPTVLKAHAREIGALGKVLGEINDLDVYRNHLTGPEASGLNRDRTAALLELVAARIATLEGESLARGRRLFAAKPRHRARDWTGLWKAQRRRRVAPSATAAT